MTKKYSIEDITSSNEPKEFTIPWEDGEIDIRIRPLKYGEYLVMQGDLDRKNPNSSDKVASQKFGLKIMSQVVRKAIYSEDGEITDWEELTEKEARHLPPGLVAEIMEKVNQVLGMSASVEDVKKLLGTMNEQKE